MSNIEGERIGADMSAVIAAFAALLEGVTVMDRSGVIRAANPAAGRILGVQTDAISGHGIEHPLGEAFFPDGTAVTGQNSKSVEALRTGRPVRDVLLRFLTPAGAERWLQASYQPLFRSGEEEPWAVLSSFADITERRAEQAALAERERDYRVLAENATDMIARATPDSIYTYVSPACRELVGYEPEELVGRNAFDFVHPDDIPALEQVHHQLLTTDTLLVTETRRRRKDGSYIWMETTVRGVRDADTGAVRETQSAARDINARKEIEEELRRSNTELEEFAAVASHDLAAPLATMAGYAEVLRSQYGDALGHGGATLVARITGNATRMRGLIDDLLDLAHAGSGNLVHEPVALETVVEEVLAALDGRIEETGAQVDASGLPVVEGDRGLLTRLFLNLIGNALKFVAPGTTPEVSVTARRAGLHWAVGVCDRGIGLPEEGSEQAFEAFRRLHAGDSYQGTGLGLSICRRIARAHGGEITAERRGGGGTIFTVTLPAAD